jgi:HEAT repeat protein
MSKEGTEVAVVAVSEVLRLTLWMTFVSLALTALVTVVLIGHHSGSAREREGRRRVRGRFEALAARLLALDDVHAAAAELRPVVANLDRRERAVSAELWIRLVGEATPERRARILEVLREAGVVASAERGTRRFSPWRRALACDVLARIGDQRCVPVLLERLGDRRPEVRSAAIRALGEIGSPIAAPAVGEAFLSRRLAPASVLSEAISRLGSAGADVFEQGLESADPVVRISASFGLAAVTDEPEAQRARLARQLAWDGDPAVRSAVCSALGIIGGEAPPAELVAATRDGDLRVRRSAVKALGAFDDPSSVEPLIDCADDPDRETAIRAAEALTRLARRPHAGARSRTRMEEAPTWSIRYAQAIAELRG